MILNTDLHNPNVTNKMTVEEFIKNNKSSGLFKEVPEDYFKKIYQDLYIYSYSCGSSLSLSPGEREKGSS